MEFSDSLKKSRDFGRVYQNGTSKANRCLVIYVLQNGSTENRLGISVSKKVGNSVVRHRITRLIRESYRLHEGQFDRGWDIVAVARPSCRDQSYHTIEACLLHGARMCGVLKGETGESR